MTLLETRGLTKRFGRLTAVRQMDWRVEPGERHAIIGPNGAGKTTLFHIITGRLRPSAGNVQFQGVDITGLAPHKIALSGLARSFQITNIFMQLSVHENIRLAIQARHVRRGVWWGGRNVVAQTADRAMTLLEQLNLASAADALAGTLSYGDQRRLEIGLALATNPVLILLDEPTAGMSRGEAHEVVDFLQQVPREITIVLIEHDIDVVFRLSDRVTVMHLGAMLAQGTPREVERDERVREAYFGGEVGLGGRGLA
jgi:branched-chain amino acid transport system ATP-binding protein